MKNRLGLSLLLGSLLSAGMLYLAFRNVPMAGLLAYLGRIEYVWLIPAIGALVLAFVLRVIRWRLIVHHTIRLQFWEAFHPLMIGFMMNCVLPGRIGELARPAILKKRHGVAMSTGVATVATERIFDAVLLIALLALVLPAIARQPELSVAFAGFHLDGHTLQTAIWAMVRLSAVLLIGVVLLAVPPTQRLLLRINDIGFAMIGRFIKPMNGIARRGAEMSNHIIIGFAAGLNMGGDWRRALGCAFLTVLVWGASALILVVLAQGCPGIDLTWLELSTVMVIICFFIALPSVPGFWGLWEAGGVFALALFGVPEKDAAGFTLVSHAVQVFPLIAIGLISALVTSINIMHLTGNNGAEISGFENNGSTLREPS
ncbi:MAG: flippase-like domain-containing protein [Desulfatitalea sp.]|nr:flippase-like domain-containing protein [Desulfatitalea sp.]NNK01557.1 flippase-like domain-containing protein [Desulfatitalea sp.]